MPLGSILPLQLLSPTTLRGRFARGAFWSLVAAVISQASNLLSAIICARVLGKTGFGEFGIIQSTAGVAGVFAGMGLGLTTVRYIAQFRISDPHRTGRIIGCTTYVAAITGTVAALALYLGAGVVARTVNSPQLESYFRIASVLIAANTLTGAQNGAIAGFEAFKAVATVNLLTALVTFPMIAGGVLNWGLRGAVVAAVIGSLAGCLISRLALNKQCAKANIVIHTADAWSERHIFWSFSLPALLSDIVLSPAAWIGSALLANTPQGYDAVGVFSAANQWRTVLTFVPSIVGQVLIPLTSSLQGTNGARQIRTALIGATAVNAACALPVFVILMFFRSRVMGLYGASFLPHGAVLTLTAATGALCAIQAPVGNMIAGLGRMWVGALQNCGWAVVLILSAWFFLQRGWGAEGLAAAYLLAYIIHSVWTLWFGFSLIGGLRGTGLPAPTQEHEQTN